MTTAAPTIPTVSMTGAAKDLANRPTAERSPVSLSVSPPALVAVAVSVSPVILTDDAVLVKKVAKLSADIAAIALRSAIRPAVTAPSCKANVARPDAVLFSMKNSNAAARPFVAATTAGVTLVMKSAKADCSEAPTGCSALPTSSCMFLNATLRRAPAS